MADHDPALDMAAVEELSRAYAHAIAEAQRCVAHLCTLLTPWLLAQADPTEALALLQRQPFAQQGWVIPEEVLQQCASAGEPAQ